MADRDEFHVLVVAYLEFFPELIQKFVEHGAVAIHAEREADGGVLHQVQF